jgi:mannose/fructose/N-acetylgalactosamine-specific phosphotransferase system component IIC
MEFSPRIVGVFTLFLFMYFSSMAVFYLFYSIVWKKWDGNSKKIYFFHFLAVVIALLSLVHRNIWLHLGINILLFIFVAITTYIVHRESKTKKKHNFYAVYILLFIFWILNIINILIPRFLEMFQMLIYLASSVVFLLIVYKVLKKAGN